MDKLGWGCGALAVSAGLVYWVATGPKSCESCCPAGPPAVAEAPADACPARCSPPAPCAAEESDGFEVLEVIDLSNVSAPSPADEMPVYDEPPPAPSWTLFDGARPQPAPAMPYLADDGPAGEEEAELLPMPHEQEVELLPLPHGYDAELLPMPREEGDAPGAAAGLLESLREGCAGVLRRTVTGPAAAPCPLTAEHIGCPFSGRKLPYMPPIGAGALQEEEQEVPQAGGAAAPRGLKMPGLADGGKRPGVDTLEVRPGDPVPTPRVPF
ncbi:MAG TPA: hypothetical protein VIL46_01575 [Gemmataceae bacterium]